MGGVLNLMGKLKSMDTDGMASDAVRNTKEVIADLNVIQMNQGIRSDGSEILPSYTDRTITIKKLKGQETRWVTLRDKGDYQAGTFVRVEGERIISGSTDPKAEHLDKKYSTKRGKLHGLSPKFKQEYINESLKLEWIRQIKAKLQLK